MMRLSERTFRLFAAWCLTVAVILSSSLEVSANDTVFEITGKSSLEISAYEDKGQFARQDYRYNVSLALAPEFYWEWNGGEDSFTFVPFVRVDEKDSERSRGDVRELSWLHVAGDWEFRTGIRKVFWGVTEFAHLIDVINQTDQADSFDGEEKLGQPMLNISRFTDWGVIDGFVLPGFRERTFVGVDGRLRSPVLVDEDHASYESADKQRHIDYALRWRHSVGVLDMGVYWFDGTDRSPVLQSTVAGSQAVLMPFYQQVTQWGVDLQATVDSWLWKFEGLQKNSSTSRYLASQAGVEYTFYGVNQSVADVGMLLEYGWDERGVIGGNAQNDVSLGARLTLNDVDDTALLIGITYDNDHHTRSVLVEASRRLNDYWTVSLEGLLFHAKQGGDPVAFLDQDDRLQLTLERYF